MRNRRSLAEARDQLIRSKGGNCSAEEAEQRIITELADGRRRAEGILPGRIHYEPISEALWHQTKPSLPPSSPPWVKPEPVVTVDFEAGSAIAKTGEGYREIREVLDHPPADEPAAPGRPQPTPRRLKNPGGRPPKYDWDEFWIEIVNIANSLDGLPDRPTLMKLLKDKIDEWEWEDLPSDTSMKDKLSRLYASLRNQPR